MEASANQISRAEAGDENVKIRVEWTRFGVVLASVGLAFFGLGMWRVDGVMAAMGLAAWVLLGLGYALGRNNLSGWSLVYRGPRRVEVGKGFDAKLELGSGSRLLDGFWIEFGVDVMAEKSFGGRVIWLGSHASVEVVRWISLKKRGMRDEQLGWMSSRFPLGLFRFRREMRISAEVGVIPVARVPKELSFSGFLLDGMPLGGSRRFGGMGEWMGLREWRNGDAVRKVAWAASIRSQASGGGLLVQQEEPPGSIAESCVVVFHSYGTDRNLIRPDRFEYAISWLCGVVSQLLGSGIPLRVLADFWEWESMEVETRRDFLRLKERLMMVKRAEWTEAHDVLSALTDLETRECLVVISDMPMSSWKSLIPKTVLEPVLVDIANYRGAGMRRLTHKKQGVAR